MNGTEEREKEIKLLNAAASIDLLHSIPNIIQIMTYRQTVANEIINSKGTEDKLKALESIMKYTGEQIKMLIGLE